MSEEAGNAVSNVDTKAVKWNLNMVRLRSVLSVMTLTLSFIGFVGDRENVFVQWCIPAVFVLVPLIIVTALARKREVRA